MFNFLGMLILVIWVCAMAGVVWAEDGDTDWRDFDKLWNYGDPAGSEEKFRELLPLAEKGDDAEALVCLHSQIARCQGLQSQFEAADATLDQAEALLTGGMSLARCRILLERGRVLNSSGKREESVPLFLAALEAAEEGGHEFFAVDAAHMLGIAEKPEQALEWNMKAIAMAEQAKSAKARGWLGPLYNNTGWTWHDMGEFEKALTLFEKSQAYREKEGQAQGTRIAKWCVARCLRSLKRSEEALAMQELLLAEYESAGARQDGYVFEELAECLRELGRDNEAKPYFAKAYELLAKDQWLQANEKERLDRLKKMGCK